MSPPERGVSQATCAVSEPDPIEAGQAHATLLTPIRAAAIVSANRRIESNTSS